MESPVQQAARLLGALSDLIGLEESYLRAGAYEMMAELRERSAPVVQQLVELAQQPGVNQFEPRVAALVRRSALHSVILDEKMQELGAEIRRTDQARRRAAQLAPAYVRSPGSVVPKFLAAG